MSLSSCVVPASRSVRQILRLCQRQQIHPRSFSRGIQSYTSPAALETAAAYRHPLSQIRYLSDKAEEAPTEEKTEEEQAAAQEETPAEEEVVEEEEVSREQELEKEVQTLKDQLLRSLAEQENTRHIAKRDVEAARSFAVSSFAKSLLDTSDNLTRALEAVPEEYRNDRDQHPVLATLYEGIQMTDEGLTKAFAKNGLEKFGEVGEIFDPNRHEALFEYPNPNAPPGTVGQVMKVGFKLHDRVVRPAEVGVVKKE